ncbi:MAG: hypothetical protein HQM16_10710 [Deltaproteobacteria bacterium]|nr:hypothetical protein [Deltaproteobacteria bacterium]
MNTSTKIKDVYVIAESQNKEDKSRWTKIGVAFLNKDDSINVILDAVPITGKLHIRDRKEKE